MIVKILLSNYNVTKVGLRQLAFAMLVSTKFTLLQIDARLARDYCSWYR